MDLVTVTYSGDLDAMRLQAHSLDLFATEPVTHHVYVEDSALDLATWHAALAQFYARNQLVLYDGNSLLNSRLGTVETTGWVRHQPLKLLAARHVQGPRYLVLDCKNILLKPVDFRSWPVQHGNGRSNLGVWLDGMDYFLPDLIAYTGIPRPATLVNPITPWVMHSDLALQCFDRGYLHWLLRHPEPFEFTLYSFVAEEANRSVGFYQDPTCFGIWQPDQMRERKSLDGFYAKPEIVMIALHRDAVSVISDKSHTIARWLADIGLDPQLIAAYVGV